MTSKDITEIIFTVAAVFSIMTTLVFIMAFLLRMVFEETANAIDQRIADAIRGDRNHD